MIHYVTLVNMKMKQLSIYCGNATQQKIFKTILSWLQIFHI